MKILSDNPSLKLNFGGGRQKIPTFTNVDLIKFGDNIVHNLNEFPYPFKDNSIDSIKAFHIIEHLDNYEQFLKECLRILKPNGKIHIKVPHFTAHGAFSEFHKHKGFWYHCFTSRRLFTKTSLEVRENSIYPHLKEIKRKINFENIYPWNWIIQPLVNFWIMPLIYETTFLHSLFPATEIEIIFIKI
jgi:ubiquinone/menaquinone biosynthesis C-methylase UbiE